jgi:hypothetical protein
MNNRIETFMAEVRAMPGVIAAANVDPAYSHHLDAIERCFEWAHETGDLDPAAIEIFDEIARVASSNERSIRDRLLEIGRLLVKARDLGRTVQ